MRHPAKMVVPSATNADILQTRAGESQWFKNFLADVQLVESLAQQQTTLLTFVNKLTLNIPAGLNGTYILFYCGTVISTNTEVRVYDGTNVLQLMLWNQVQVGQNGGFVPLVLTGSAMTITMDFRRTTNGTATVRDFRMAFFRRGE